MLVALILLCIYLAFIAGALIGFVKYNDHVIKKVNEELNGGPCEDVRNNSFSGEIRTHLQ